MTAPLQEAETLDSLVEVYNSLITPAPHLAGVSSYVLSLDYILRLTQKDIDNGQLFRYFAQRTNHPNGEILEISETQYQKFSQLSSYVTAKINWKIKGKLDDIMGNALIVNQPSRFYTGVITANTLAIQDGDNQLPGLRFKLSNPVQFYQGE